MENCLLNKALTITCSAPVNIAVIKYWGKRDEQLILPLNSSLSGTLNQKQLCSLTTVSASLNFEKDQLYLNGVAEEPLSKRLENCLRAIRERANDKYDQSGNLIISKENLRNCKVHICSENNFPTAAGLASSASGFACLVFALAKLFEVQGDVSALARLGSGSACRSIYGGFVAWRMGSNPDGSDSIAEQICDEKFWPEIRILILVVNDQRKDISSTTGMQQSVKTSPIMQDRINITVPQRMLQIEQAILNKDFATFADLTMKDSDDFHEVCHTTNPPIYYLNDISRKIIRIINSFNASLGSPKIAYTFDAGPNAVLYLLDDVFDQIVSIVLKNFPQTESLPLNQYLKGFSDVEITKVINNQQQQSNIYIDDISQPCTGQLKYILSTNVGPGPQIIDNNVTCLLNENGLPKNLKSL
eukprot:TRINITY_DN2779_c0_g1_i1.p1 TRINITY_DN2779_c0_g1~~TRINITY_DN2779_c0_g1_i1.p1  ORF type:complete len:416 (-),score=161.86 TRINITY_DN2779_c0_g1_i1:44-1291(-)